MYKRIVSLAMEVYGGSKAIFDLSDCFCLESNYPNRFGKTLLGRIEGHFEKGRMR